MTAIAALLKKALKEKGWSISKAATEADVNRFFLNRLVNGNPPPRKKEGGLTAEDDERYAKVAVALDLDEEQFIDTVLRIQAGRPAREKKTDSPDNANDLRSLPRDFEDRFARYRKHVEENWPLTEDRCLTILERCILDTDLSPSAFDKTKYISNSSLRDRRTYDSMLFEEHNYIGTIFNKIRPGDALSEEKRISSRCTAIAEALVAVKEASEREQATRVDIALLFYELATIDRRRIFSCQDNP